MNPIVFVFYDTMPGGLQPDFILSCSVSTEVALGGSKSGFTGRSGEEYEDEWKGCGTKKILVKYTRD